MKNGPTVSHCYQLTDKVKEAHENQIYGCAINDIDPNNVNLVATVGGRQATVYRLSKEGKLQVMQYYLDEDEDEIYFCCKFTYLTKSDTPVLLLAGQQGLVKVIDLTTGKLVRVLVGHGDAINEIAVEISRPHLIFTASKDYTARAWNVSTGCCVISVSGRQKHMQDVLSVDICPLNPDWFVTASFDGSIKIWSMSAYVDKYQLSEEWTDAETKIFPTQILHIPLFATQSIHAAQVDCVRWFGSLGIYSKSVFGKICLWRPKKLVDDKDQLVVVQSEFDMIEELDYEDVQIWFMRFGMDAFHTRLACGTGKGKMFIWDVTADIPTLIDALKVHEDFVVRQTGVLPDGEQIVCCCDDGRLYAYKLKEC